MIRKLPTPELKPFRNVPKSTYKDIKLCFNSGLVLLQRENHSIHYPYTRELRLCYKNTGLSIPSACRIALRASLFSTPPTPKAGKILTILIETATGKSLCKRAHLANIPNPFRRLCRSSARRWIGVLKNCTIIGNSNCEARSLAWSELRENKFFISIGISSRRRASNGGSTMHP